MLAAAVERAIDAANDAADDDGVEDDDPTRETRQEEADAIAGEIRAGQQRPGPDSQA